MENKVTDSANILLVEDDHLLRNAFRLLLEDRGYHIVEAGLASEAIALAKADAEADVEKKAAAYCDKVKPCFDKVRAVSTSRASCAGTRRRGLYLSWR